MVSNRNNHIQTNIKYSLHIFNNHSEGVHVFGNQLDYVSVPTVSLTLSN